jgi:hypothetical protein
MNDVQEFTRVLVTFHFQDVQKLLFQFNLKFNHFYKIFVQAQKKKQDE